MRRDTHFANGRMLSVLLDRPLLIVSGAVTAIFFGGLLYYSHDGLAFSNDGFYLACIVKLLVYRYRSLWNRNHSLCNLTQGSGRASLAASQVPGRGGEQTGVDILESYKAKISTPDRYKGFSSKEQTYTLDQSNAERHERHQRTLRKQVTPIRGGHQRFIVEDQAIVAALRRMLVNIENGVSRNRISRVADGPSCQIQLSRSTTLHSILRYKRTPAKAGDLSQTSTRRGQMCSRFLNNIGREHKKQCLKGLGTTDNEDELG